MGEKVTHEQWITQARAAELCGVTERTMRRWVATGRIPTVLRAGVRRIHLSQLRLEQTHLFEAMRAGGM